MTTYEGMPSFGTFMAMKLANRVAKARRNDRVKEGTRAYTWVQSLVRLVTHLAGFSLLTSAGFTWNMTAGLIVAGISCFAMAWLMNDPAPQTSNVMQPTVDPMASRR